MSKPSVPVSVRAARLDDAPAIAGVHVTAWKETYHRLLPAHFLAALTPEKREPFWQRMIADSTGKQTVRVAQAPDGAVIGFAAAGPESGHLPEIAGELYAIYLLSPFQGLGVGRRLFKEVAGFLHQQGHATMGVWVLRDNPSRRFYQALGGRPAGRKPITIGGANLPEIAYSWSLPIALSRPYQH